MYNVNNSGIIGRISRRSLKNSRTRNTIAIVAIILTAVMFTTLFTVGTSLMESFQLSTMRQVGTRSHGGFKFITWPQYEKMAADPKVVDISYNVIVGYGQNPEFNKLYAEIRYTEEKCADWSFSLPTVGTLPKGRMELATSTAVLDAIGVPHELGAAVPLEFTANGIKYKESFTLCGWWENATTLDAEEVYLSPEYGMEVAPVWQEEREFPDMHDGTFAGAVNSSLYFKSTWNLAGQMEALKERCGFGPEVNDGTNWAYATESVDMMTLLLVIGLLVVIMMSGYLIIYNIFYISVSGDIKFYGLLKTIGTTNKQLKRIVRRQALLLSLVGIPFGLAVGYGLSFLILPAIVGITSAKDIVMSINPFIFIGSGIFTLITVWISCIRPCRFVSRISPVEAVRYTENAPKKRKKSKRTRAVNPLTMALSNMGRTPKKTVAVVLSLSLSLILLNGTVTMVKGFDMDKYVQNMVVSDFYITDASVLNTYAQVQSFDSITPELRSQIEALDGVTETGSVYLREYQHFPDSEALERAKNIFDEYNHTLDHLPHVKEAVKNCLDEGQLYSHIYGVDGLALDKLRITEGELDTEKFMSGNYVIASAFANAENAHFYEIGDKVTLDLDGTSKEYEVIALGNIAYATGPHHGHGFDVYFTLPSEEFMSLTGNTGALNTLFNVTPEALDSVEEWVKNYCDRVNTYLDYRSKQYYVDNFKDIQNTYLLVGGLLSFILALIGILNFINAVVTSIQSRRQELAVLQSIGMTGRQLKKMLIGEGAGYIASTVLFVLTVGSLLCYCLIMALADQLMYFSYHFVIMPILLSLPVLVIFAVAIPMASYRYMCRKSIVDRLRETEN